MPTNKHASPTLTNTFTNTHFRAPSKRRLPLFPRPPRMGLPLHHIKAEHKRLSLESCMYHFKIALQDDIVKSQLLIPVFTRGLRYWWRIQQVWKSVKWTHFFGKTTIYIWSWSNLYHNNNYRNNCGISFGSKFTECLNTPLIKHSLNFIFYFGAKQNRTWLGHAIELEPHSFGILWQHVSEQLRTRLANFTNFNCHSSGPQGILLIKHTILQK